MMPSPTMAPLVVPLPELPVDSGFTEDQWLTLMSIMDVIVPSIGREPKSIKSASDMIISEVNYNAAVDRLKIAGVSASDIELFDEYLAEKPSSSPEFHNLLKSSLAASVPADVKKGLCFVLSALNNRLGSLILTGYTAPFSTQPYAVRISIIQGWRQSYLPQLPALFKSLSLMAKSIWLKSSPTLHKMIGFPTVPVNYKPGPHYEYGFLQFTPGDNPEFIETDVIVVGSGCGGSVCAKNLAEAGNRVLVVEKSYYFPPAQVPMKEDNSAFHLFENGGSIASDDSSIYVVAGSTWGGGGAVNWSASLQPQWFVRKEWSEDRGLSFFGTDEFQACLDRVCDRMGVSTDHIRHNHANQVLLEGARRLGYHAKAVPQNTGGHEHYDGYCSLGCGSAEKHGPLVTWLPDAAKAGATFAEGFKVENVIFENIKGKKTAVGVKGLWTSRDKRGGVVGPKENRIVKEVIVKAKKVILSCGTLWTPIILMNSGLTNPHIGRNLYLHPVNLIGGMYKEDVKPWEGGILTSVCTTFENIDGHGHGVKLETIAMMPSFFLSSLNWTSGLDFKLNNLKFRHMTGLLAIARDRETGRVYKDPVSGSPRIEYTPSKFDCAHLMEGISAIAKIQYATGAEEIHPCVQGMEPFIRNPDPTSPAFAADLDARFHSWISQIKAAGNGPPAAVFCSAHQMGTSRMSTSPTSGVVNPQGQVWGVEGLFVSDASVFPSASGVNPMVTNMAISDWISRGIARDLNREKGGVEVGARL